jgi:hypothetical protein
MSVAGPTCAITPNSYSLYELLYALIQLLCDPVRDRPRYFLPKILLERGTLTSLRANKTAGSGLQGAPKQIQR